ncbi:MAG: 4Fe-4S binding protein [Planctomycetota bacterium]
MQSPREGCEGYRRPAGRFPGRAGRRRAYLLGGVHLLIGLHLAHWLLTGTTLSPVEPSESMYTLENGQVNAGFIFFIIAILSTAIFGRWFCGWACHMVALQDLCGWMMRKIGIQPRPFRSRLLGYVPYLLAFYMFIWPTFKRWSFPWLEQKIPALQNWFDPVTPWPDFSNHLMTQDFWATFPSLLIAIPFFFICGFATVYLLGAKGFCTYGCPYGAFFSVADRVSPMTIVANMDACESCGLCTANCSSNVQISKEIHVHQQVVDPGCMKCLDCVDVCPNGVLSYGASKPSLLALRQPDTRKITRKSDLSLTGEILLAIVFTATWFSWRGVYEQIPLLMATGIALCVSFLLWKSALLLRRQNTSLQGLPLHREQVTSPAGRVVLGVTLLTVLLTISAGQSRWNQNLAATNMSQAMVNLDQVLIRGQQPIPEPIRIAAKTAAMHLHHLLRFDRGGYALMEPDGTVLEERIGYMSAIAGDLPEARKWWEQAILENPSDDLLLRYGQLLELVDGPDQLARWLDTSRTQYGPRAVLVSLRADLGRRQAFAALKQGQPQAAAQHLQALVGWVGEDPGLLDDISLLLDQAGDNDAAKQFRERARVIRENTASANPAVDPNRR